MKGLKLLFAVLLVPLAFQAAIANEDIDTSRAATRRGATNTVSANRQKTNPTDAKNTVQPSLPTSRTVNIDASEKSSSGQERNTDKQLSNRSGTNVVNRTASSTQNKTISARTTSNVQQRVPSNDTSRVMTRTSTPNQSTLSRTGTISRNATVGRSGTITPSRSRSATTARSGTTPLTTIAPIQSRNFSACRDVFYECMDEFCANKDSTLKRCACSARIHEFDKTKEQLAAVEDKLLDFSQRLLTVNMDKEDALAINTATEGEVAYAVQDTSKSKKLLDDIAKKLNTSFNDSNFDQNLNAISLSLNTDAAFDNIDSMMGASTTTKSGTELYRAALPICREMALEICSENDLSIAESGYQMSIAQDCNTVAKSYETQNDQARAKIKESSALLDMSRLNIHQERNSDDILTCKAKMLEKLTDTTVCGTDMVKCLDYTGRYIDPTTGQAFLTDSLAQLTTLITRPTPEETWTSAAENKDFILFLQSKKAYLEPAMENCQDISTYVWDAFIEDALAQIKLAQDAKLEEVRQSCTTLTTQCLSDVNQSITDFDARALSVFGVKADLTVNAMCADIKNTCTALINAIGTTTDEKGNTINDWQQGITEITTEKTYTTLLNTCREVGKNCIIRTCTDISGNFGLCTNIDTSVNRKSVISRRACWGEVEQCIRDAGEEAINNIMTKQGRTANYKGGHIYDILYGNKGLILIETTPENPAAVCNIKQEPIQCPKKTYKYPHQWWPEGKDAPTFDWQVYRLTEQIWGNCENNPSDETNDYNRIIINYDELQSDNTDETLLSWFARNTNTADALDSCRDTTCGYGTTLHEGMCVSTSQFSDTDKKYCPVDNPDYTQVTDSEGCTNCCSKKHYKNSEALQVGTDEQGPTICCVNGTISNPEKSEEIYSAEVGFSSNVQTTICNPGGVEATGQDTTLVFSTETDDYYCVGGEITTSNNSLECYDGVWVSISKDPSNQVYKTPTNGGSLNYVYDSNGVATNSGASNGMIGTPTKTETTQE